MANLTIAKVREYIKDKPEFNYLLEGDVQSSDSLIALAMEFALEDFNMLVNPSSYTLQTAPSDVVLLYGTLSHLAMTEAERHLRNQISFNAQGIAVDVDGKFAQYQALSTYYRNLAENLGTSIKAKKALAETWGQAYSPYVVINTANFK